MKSAILVIDVQCGLFDVDQRPFEADEVIKRINKITNQARTSKIPVIFIQHENSLMKYGSESWKLQSGLMVNNSDLKIRKTTPDSFLRTTLKKILTSHEVNSLIICGYATEFCVDTTVRRAAALGYTVQLVSNAHTTHDKEHASAKEIREHHNVTLPSISSFGPKIIAVQSAEINFKG